MYFESTWKCANNYPIVDFSRFDASSQQLFCAMEDESHFNIKLKRLAGKVRWAEKNSATFQLLLQEALVRSCDRMLDLAIILIFVILMSFSFVLVSYGTNKMHYFTSTYWCQYSLGTLGPVIVSINLLFQGADTNMYLKIQQHVFYLYFWFTAHRKNDTQASDLHYLENDLITCGLDKYLLHELNK